MTASRAWRVALASAASAAMLVAAPLVGVQAAYAQPYPPPPPLTLSTTTVTAGETVSYSTPPGIFTPGQAVTVLLESRTIVLGHNKAKSDGSVAGTVTIPTYAPNGWHTFRISSDHPDPSVATSIYVQGGVEPGKPGHGDHDRPGGHEHHGSGGHGGDDDRGGPDRHLGRADDMPYQKHTGQHRSSLAETGEKALALGGTAAVLLTAGGGTMLAVRRRRNS